MDVNVPKIIFIDVNRMICCKRFHGKTKKEKRFMKRRELLMPKEKIEKEKSKKKG
jgi:hypothetical protein